MAPLAPSKPSARTLRHQRITGQIHPLAPAKTFRPDASTTDTFLSTKRDKRLIKSSAFLSRVSASSSAGISKSKKRTRRPGKKLLAASNLGSLADALPDLEDESMGGREERGKVRHRSLKSKKGAMKKKERVVKGEMQRFGASMAKLTGMEEAAAAPPATTEKMDTTAQGDKGEAQLAKGTANRWAALRGYISSTMEQNPAFAR
ncbi:hypothetical protein NLU13_0946 [Sarocladium strictum]|uniref:Ribosome biogenesis protein SLX9 n=1 Tax=Sarocladium strictum TaxID=5046 RepID=A0AA39LBW6_SARSR|nr:hypothetical protein NLU13_0946 [Sarocladium strictum]